MTKSIERSEVASEMLLEVLREGTIPYGALLQRLGRRLGSEFNAGLCLAAFTALAKSGAVVSSTPWVDGEPAIGNDTSVTANAFLAAFVEEEAD